MPYNYRNKITLKVIDKCIGYFESDTHNIVKINECVIANKAINEISNGSFPISDDLSLINALDGTIYDVDKTILDNKILNSTKLILI